MIWKYTAINELAGEVKGIACGRRRDIVERLGEKKLLIIDLEVDVMASCQGILCASTVPAGELSVFFKDLGNMFQAGLTLSHVLGTLQDGISSAKIRGACVQMKESLVSGKPLAQAMEEVRIFPPLALNAVRAGERSGQLVFACGLLTEYFHLISTLKGKIFRALIYPFAVFIFLCVGLVYVSQAVVPPLMSFLPADAMDGGLTRFMLAVSHTIEVWWLMLVLMTSGGLVLVVFLMSHYRRAADALLGRIPFFGALRKDMDIALCFFDIYILLKSGIPLDAALRETAGTGATLARRKLEVCSSYLVSGDTFAQALAATDYFPALLIETIRIGEEIGAYGDYCERVFRFYYRSFEMRLGALAAVVQPVLLAVCAALLMAFALAFLKPIYANLTHIGVLQP
ncbi:MAG: type II secretion system F family protein [Candidatus Omnitrophica bacterium]|nr:type II secretion system F family protein [Candidatus Omnitrophota bacterium]